jgi:type IX secretion system PorP/SprF family membrane protein
MPRCCLVKFFLAILIFAGFLTKVQAQQDPLYSQYHFNQLVINPAYAGIYNNTNFSFISRVQWALTGIEGTPFTNSLIAQTSVVHNKVGMGLIVVQDKLGVANNYEVHLPLSYKINWGDKTFSFGMQPGIQSVNYNYDNLLLRSADDPSFQGSESAVKPNVGAGVALMSDKMFIGISVPRLINTEFTDGITSSLRYRRHFYGSFSYLLPLNSYLKLKPGVLVRAVEGAPVSYDINALLLVNNMIWAGAYTRSFETVGILFQWDYKTAYRFGYNFEFPVANSLPFGYTTHEFMFSIDLSLFGEQDVFQRFF